MQKISFSPMKWQPARTQGDVHVCPSMQTQGIAPGYICYGLSGRGDEQMGNVGTFGNVNHLINGTPPINS